jgi:hypothetical protein
MCSSGYRAPKLGPLPIRIAATDGWSTARLIPLALRLGLALTRVHELKKGIRMSLFLRGEEGTGHVPHEGVFGELPY